MKENITFRLALARGFLNEAQQDFSLGRWRATVSHAQLAVENALKAVIGVFLPVPKTHDPARILLELIARQQIPPRWQKDVQQVAEMGEPLGPQLHVQTDYGDEFGGRLPWALFGEEEARETLTRAETILARVEQLVQEATDDN
jgi:HEPN domain-containing protein